MKPVPILQYLDHFGRAGFGGFAGAGADAVQTPRSTPRARGRAAYFAAAKSRAA